jgi:hypothetical protein
MVLKLLDKETLSQADLQEIFASVDKRPARTIVTARKPPQGRPPVLTAAELALLGPNDVAALTGNGNGTRSRGNGSRTNGARSTGTRSNGTRATGSRSSASTRGRANQTAKSAETPTPRKRTSRRQAPGTST